MTDFKEMQAIANRVIERGTRADLNRLNERDRVFFLLWCFGGVIDNGGIPAFFYNSPANYYSETLDALRLLGLGTFADLLERAAGLLFRGNAPRGMDERNPIIDALPEDESADEQLEELNRECFREGGGDYVLDVLERWYFQNKPKGQRRLLNPLFGR